MFGRGDDDEIDVGVLDDLAPVVGGLGEAESFDRLGAPGRNGIGADDEHRVGDSIGEQRRDAAVGPAVGLAHPAEPDNADAQAPPCHRRGRIAGRAGHRATRVGRHADPRLADPVVRRVVAERHRPLVAGAGQDVQVVEGIARRGDARAVVAAVDEEHVTVGDVQVEVDLAVDGVGAVEAKPIRVVRRRAVPPDPEVVDLLVVDRAVGVVAVRRVARPVAARRQQLDAHQLVGAVERLR